jgi:hypothetical protein
MIDRLLRRFRARIDANQPTQTTEATKENMKRDLNILRANVLAIRGRDVQQPSAAPPPAMDSRGEIQPHEY